jgi:thioredoxin reductase
MSSNTLYDAIIIGSRPAGLQAALALSRVCRSTLIISIPDVRRNLAADKMHNFLTQDGTPPPQFLLTAKEEILRYEFARFENGKVISAKKVDDNFRVALEDRRTFAGRKLLLATGSKDMPTALR